MKFNIQEELKKFELRGQDHPIDPARFIEDGVKGEALVELLNQVDERLSKQSRLQYKSYQDTLKKMDQVLEAAQTIEHAFQQNQGGIDMLIRTIDDLDQAHSMLEAQNQQEWALAIAQLTQRIIHHLQEAGIVELAVLGQLFDPQLSEGIGTEEAVAYDVDRYRIIKVVRRGWEQHGKVWRKAHVITTL